MEFYCVLSFGVRVAVKLHMKSEIGDHKSQSARDLVSEGSFVVHLVWDRRDKSFIKTVTIAE